MLLHQGTWHCTRKPHHMVSIPNLSFKGLLIIPIAAYYLDPATAQHLLDIIQPIQIGYGAVLLSFLGAIHWGLEFAGVGGHLVHLFPQLHLRSNLFPKYSLGDRDSVDTFWESWLRHWLGPRSSSPSISPSSFNSSDLRGCTGLTTWQPVMDGVSNSPLNFKNI
jgi:Protein of unknown function (DUF3429)